MATHSSEIPNWFEKLKSSQSFHLLRKVVSNVFSNQSENSGFVETWIMPDNIYVLVWFFYISKQALINLIGLGECLS